MRILEKSESENSFLFYIYQLQFWRMYSFSHTSNDVLRVSGRTFFFTQRFADPESPGSFRFRKRIKRLPGRRFQVCDNTLLGICVSRRNAVSAGKGRKALQLIED